MANKKNSLIYWRTVFHIIYRVIKKSMCTWRLYCNHQVHRGFFDHSVEIAAVWIVLVMASFMFRICSPLWDVFGSTPVGYVAVVVLPVLCITAI